MIYSLLLLALAPSFARAATATCSSGLSRGALAAIIVESAVIAVLSVALIAVYSRRKRSSALSEASRIPERQDNTKIVDDDETTSLRHDPSLTHLDVESVYADDAEYPLESQLPRPIPTLLRPRSLTPSSPPSVRSSTLYDAIPPFQIPPHPEYHNERPKTSVNLVIPSHRLSLSTVTLPNPHSDHGHADTGAGSGESPLRTEITVDPNAVATLGQSETTRASARRLSDSSWDEDILRSLSRRPTPISRKSSVSSLLDNPGRVGNVHDLLLSRQNGSEAPLQFGDQHASTATEH